MTNCSPKRVHYVALPPTIKKGPVSPHCHQHQGLILFLLFQKRQMRVLILRSPVPLGLGRRTELIKVSFLLSPNSPAENRQQTLAQLWHVAKICTLYPKGHCLSPYPMLSLCAWVMLFSPSKAPPSSTLHNQPLFNAQL